MSSTRRMRNRRPGRSKRGGRRCIAWIDDEPQDKIIESFINMKDYNGNHMFTSEECDSFITDAILRNKIIQLVENYKKDYPYYAIIGAIALALKRVNGRGINTFFTYDEKEDLYTDEIDNSDATREFRKYRKYYGDEKQENVFLSGGRSRRYRTSRRGANKKSRKGRKSRKSRKVHKSRRGYRVRRR